MIRVRFSFALMSVLVGMCLLPWSVHAHSNDPLMHQDAYALIGVYDAWKRTTGSRDVVVAIIDNGFDHYHPDLVQNVWRNTQEIAGNGIDDDQNGYVDDVVGWNFVPEDTNDDGRIDELELRGNNNPRPSFRSDDDLVAGHATAVAGLIGATGHNELLGTGINWRVSLMNIKVVDEYGHGTIDYLPDAIRYAVDNGADVVSMSIVGSTSIPEAIADAIAYAHAHDVIVVAAAGNTQTDLNQEPLYPVCGDVGATEEQVIGVSAVMVERYFALFSNYGSDCIDITAPGIYLWSTTLYRRTASGPTEPYRRDLQGTSFSAPLVAGTAALIRSAFPNLSARDVIAAILESTSKTPPQDPVLYANLFGAGLLDVDAALRAAEVRSSERGLLLTEIDQVVHIPITPFVQVAFNRGAQALTYMIDTIPVRHVERTHAYRAPLAVHPTSGQVFVLEAPDLAAQTQVISVYTQTGRGVEQLFFRDTVMHGIFFKGDVLHGYRLYGESVSVYRYDRAIGGFVEEVTLPIASVSVLTYNEVTDTYLGLQYTKTLFSYEPQKGLHTASIPPYLTVPELVVGAGSVVMTVHDSEIFFWESPMQSRRVYVYEREIVKS